MIGRLKGKVDCTDAQWTRYVSSPEFEVDIAAACECLSAKRQHSWEPTHGTPIQGGGAASTVVNNPDPMVMAEAFTPYASTEGAVHSHWIATGSRPPLWFIWQWLTDKITERTFPASSNPLDLSISVQATGTSKADEEKKWGQFIWEHYEAEVSSRFRHAIAYFVRAELQKRNRKYGYQVPSMDSLEIIDSLEIRNPLDAEELKCVRSKLDTWFRRLGKLVIPIMAWWRGNLSGLTTVQLKALGDIVDIPCPWPSQSLENLSYRIGTKRNSHAQEMGQIIDPMELGRFLSQDVLVYASQLENMPESDSTTRSTSADEDPSTAPTNAQIRSTIIRHSFLPSDTTYSGAMLPASEALQAMINMSKVELITNWHPARKNRINVLFKMAEWAYLEAVKTLGKSTSVEVKAEDICERLIGCGVSLGTEQLRSLIKNHEHIEISVSDLANELCPKETNTQESCPFLTGRFKITRKSEASHFRIIQWLTPIS